MRNLKKKEGYFNKEFILEFKKENNIGRGNSVKHQDFKKEIVEKNPIIERLTTPEKLKVEWNNKTYNKKILLVNDEDIMMVLDVLKFISDDNKKNIYNYLRNKIVNSTVQSAYEELIGMRSISDKIATFIIRDIGLMNPEINIGNEHFKLAFPVDTWVIKISQKLGCSCEDIEKIKNYLIEKCKEYGVEPLKVAAGLWFLGFHSLDILLEHCLGEIEIGSITSANSG